MKHVFILILFLSIGTRTKAQTICNAAGNTIIYTNYDGGVLNINVDVNIPNLRIGVVSYEAVTINLSGPFVNNVVYVQYAGYNSPNNSNCAQAVQTTSINGAPASAMTGISTLAPSIVSNPNGYPFIVCGYSCETNTYQGGCNTVDQIEAYYSVVFTGMILYSHRVQYGCWSGTQNVSNGGNCCLTPAVSLALSTSVVQPSCHNTCNGSATATVTGGQSPYSFQWTGGPATATYSNLCPATYTVVVTDANNATASTTVQIVNPPMLLTSHTQSACNSYVFNGATLTQSGQYSDTLNSASGCDSVVNLNLSIQTIDTAVAVSGNTLTAQAAGASYQWINCATGMLIAGATSQSYSAPVSGTYAVAISQSGCSDTSRCINVIVLYANEWEEQQLSVYPNPGSDRLYIDGVPHHAKYLKLYDPTGRLIQTYTIRNTSQASVAVQELSSGHYYLEIDGVSKRIRFVKQ